MTTLFTRNQIPCAVPVDIASDPTPRFSLGRDNVAAIDFYNRNGFVVFKSFLEPNVADDFRGAWQSEVKLFNGYIYRQVNGLLERNVFNEFGHVMNPILNIQSLRASAFPELRSLFDSKILNNFALASWLSLLIKDKPKVVQSMYFEGNSVTWEHQDSYYLDDENIGSMCAGWLALEDILPSAGRFFVVPKSHLFDHSSMDVDNSIAFNHSSYIQSIVSKMSTFSERPIAPCLLKGDLLLWNSMTIHGSLDSSSSSSRSSITFHVIKTSSRLSVFRSFYKLCLPDSSFAFDVCRPKDLSRFSARCVFLFERYLPVAYSNFRKFLIGLIVRFKSARK